MPALRKQVRKHLLSTIDGRPTAGPSAAAARQEMPTVEDLTGNYDDSPVSSVTSEDEVEEVKATSPRSVSYRTSGRKASKRDEAMGRASATIPIAPGPVVESVKGDRDVRNAVSSPISSGGSSNTKRKRETHEPAGSQLGEVLPPTQEENDILFNKRSQQVYGSSQTASQRYGAKSRSSQTFKPQKTENVHAMPAKSQRNRPNLPARPTYVKTPSASLSTRSMNSSTRLNLPSFQHLDPAQPTPQKRPTYKRLSPTNSDSSYLSDPPSSDTQEVFGLSETYEQQLQALGTAPEHVDIITSNPNEVTCPICNTTIPRTFYKAFTTASKLGYNRAMELCAAHKARTAELRMAKSSYPIIDWDNFDTRLEHFHDSIDAVLTGRTRSTYRQDLEEKIATGKSRAAMRNPDTLATTALARSAGYYGTKGASKMTEHILKRFGERIREVAQTDGIFAEVGVPGFVRGVLVPELVVLLVMEDFPGSREERAKEIVEESAEIGELLNHDGEDVKQWVKVSKAEEIEETEETETSCTPYLDIGEQRGRDLSPDVSSLSELSDNDWDMLKKAPEAKSSSYGITRSEKARQVVDLVDLVDD